MLKQAVILFALVITFVSCLDTHQSVQRIQKQDTLPEDGLDNDAVYFARAATQWCYCCNYSNSNSECNKLRLGCYSRFPLCITTIHAPKCDDVVITKSCASVAYCDQQYRRNPPECKDGLVPVGKSCDFCCSTRGCNEFPSLTQTYSSSPYCPGKTGKVDQKTATGKQTNNPVCGENRFGNGGRVQGGGETPKGFYPWTVKIHEKLTFVGMCAGAIIDESWILTSASCIQNQNPSKYTVVAGEHSLFLPDTTEQSLDVEKIYVHPKYNSNNNKNFNVALLKIKYPIQFSESVQPICLPQISDDYSGMTCTQAGWTIPQVNDIKNVMKDGSLEVLSHQQCAKHLQGVTSDELCGYGHGKYSGLCGWDNGSPLQCKKGNQYVLVGLTSKGPHFPNCVQGNNNPNQPIVFTNVAPILKWVLDTQIMDATTP